VAEQQIQDMIIDLRTMEDEGSNQIADLIEDQMLNTSETGLKMAQLLEAVEQPVDNHVDSLTV